MDVPIPWRRYDDGMMMGFETMTQSFFLTRLDSLRLCPINIFFFSFYETEQKQEEMNK